MAARDADAGDHCARRREAPRIGASIRSGSRTICSRPRPNSTWSRRSSLLASRTSRIKLGPSVLLLNLRHPLMAAKSFASLDYLLARADGDGGRHRREPGRLRGDCGIPTERRAAGAWTKASRFCARCGLESNVSYHGRFFNFDNVTLEPHPARRTNNDFGHHRHLGRRQIRGGAEAHGADGRRLLRVLPDARGIRAQHDRHPRLCRRVWARQRAHRVGSDPALPPGPLARTRTRPNWSRCVRSLDRGARSSSAAPCSAPPRTSSSESTSTSRRAWTSSCYGRWPNRRPGHGQVEMIGRDIAGTTPVSRRRRHRARFFAIGAPRRQRA